MLRFEERALLEFSCWFECLAAVLFTKFGRVLYGAYGRDHQLQIKNLLGYLYELNDHLLQLGDSLIANLQFSCYD